MTQSADKVRKVIEDNGTFNHYIDCETKASGAAITGSGDWQNSIFGIHSSSLMTLSGNKYNVGVLITDDVYHDIESWCE